MLSVYLNPLKYIRISNQEPIGTWEKILEPQREAFGRLKENDPSDAASFNSD
jgi:hypothetical protein